MQQKFGECKQCHKNRPINSKGICSDCTYFNKHGETRFEAQIRKQKEKPKKIYSLKRKPLKRFKIKPKQKKKIGEYEVFLEIWNEREHECVNCGMNLDRFVDEETGNPSTMLFSHIKTKGSKPDLKKDKNNIELLCPDCHHIWEFCSKEKFYERKDKYRE
jgi:hypothetical protein